MCCKSSRHAAVVSRNFRCNSYQEEKQTAVYINMCMLLLRQMFAIYDTRSHAAQCLSDGNGNSDNNVDDDNNINNKNIININITRDHMSK